MTNERSPEAKCRAKETKKAVSWPTLRLYLAELSRLPSRFLYVREGVQQVDTSL